jgi:hypothetical protein
MARSVSTVVAWITAAACWVACLLPAAAAQAAPLPSFAELEAAGTTIGEIRIVANDIFDTDDPREDHLLFRLANRLHARTKPAVVRRELLFSSGERVSVRLIEETERLLRSHRYFYDVQIHPVAVHDDVVDIEVTTRDTWSLDLGISFSRQGGSNAGGLRLREYNLFGTGISLGLGRSSDVDRTGNEVFVAAPHLFGGRTSLTASHASNSDGQRNSVALLRPFYELDARWAAGLSASKDDRLDSSYVGGAAVGQWRHRQTRAEAFAGISAGLVEGRVQRWSAGIKLLDDAYALEPGRVPPTSLPADERLVAPFVRYELVEDRYERELNRNLIGRPEFFALGLATSVQLGVASRGLGSSESALLYAATASRGFEIDEQQMLMARAKVSGRIVDGQVQRGQWDLQAQYYLPQSPRWLFHTALSASSLTRPAAQDVLLLGGDNGLRGYPLRYQSGKRRVLGTVEERYYTDLYLWRLFRVGGAAYVDAGRAWGGDLVNAANPGWLANAGIGLRIVNSRSAFSDVLHIDLAYALRPGTDMQRLQFLVKTRTSF